MAKTFIPGSVAIVTGASSGVGWQTAVRLAEIGIKLCVTSRREEPLEALRRELTASGHECISIPGDVTRPGDIEAIVNGCLARYGRIDLLVNCAAVQLYGRFEQYEWEEVERIFQVNCFGYMRFARAVLPQFHEQERGHIINVLSMFALGSMQLFSAYAATKAALFEWAKCLALETHEEDIHVSNILMPALATPLYDHVGTKLGIAPKPPIPIYDVDVAARAIVDTVFHPREKVVPVWLQGKLLLKVKDWSPRLRHWVLWLTGMKSQERDFFRPIGRGNLFQPLAEGYGPRGTVQATAAWKRYAAGFALAGIAALSARGLARVASETCRRVGRVA